MRLVKTSFFLTMFLMLSSSLIGQYTTWKDSTVDAVGGYLKGYRLQGQQQDNWCWAASGSMAMNYVSEANAPEQCTEATNRYGGDCCNNGSSSTCNQGGWPEFEKYNFEATWTQDGVALTYEQIKATLAANSPICFTWRWKTRGGHMMTIDGWLEQYGVQYVHVQDPWPPNKGKTSWMTYEQYVQSSNHTHWRDAYNITY